MATSYPGAIDSYTTKTDGVSTVAAADINDVQDAIVAVETALGTNPFDTYPDVKSSIAARLKKSGDTMTGVLDMGSNRITNLADPTDDQDAATRIYVDDQWDLDVRLLFQDDFIADRDARWTLSGAGGSYVQNAAPGGTGDLSTGAASNNEATLSFNGKGCTDRSKNPKLVTRAGLNATTQLKAVLAGLYLDDNNLIEIYYDVTTTAGNFMYRCKSGGTETTADSNLAADTNLHTFAISVSATQVVFTIDEANQQTITTNIPAGVLEPRLQVLTKEAADKRLTVDYLHLRADR